MQKLTIILVPGWLHNFENEEEFISKLSKYFNVVTFKYPGYYGEKELDSLPDKYEFSDLLYLKIKKLKLKNYTLLGFSMGCQVVLHLVEKYKLKNKVVLISPTMKDLNSDIPYFLRPFIKDRKFFKIIRKNKLLSKLIVNMGYQKISRITENKNTDRKTFNNPNITIKGAFDTLYFVTTNFIDPRKYINQTKFIFGENEILQKNFDGKYIEVKNMGHGGFKNFCSPIIRTIIS